MSEDKESIALWSKNPETKDYRPDKISFSFGAGTRFFIDSTSSEMLSTNPYRKSLYEKDFNSFNYRCDEFKKSHDGMHILFTGCSVTFGEGLYKEETWPWKVYSQINKNTKTSGYFNIASSGTSIAFAILKLFKYFKTFGNPDAIFFNMPNVDRFLTFTEHPNAGTKDLESSMGLFEKLDDDSIGFAVAMQRELYSVLELYCKTNNIKLYSFSWVMRNHPSAKNPGTPSKIFKSFATFSDIYRIYNFEKYSLKQDESFATKPLKDIKIPNLIARDGSHPGIVPHSFFAASVLNLFDKDIYNDVEKAL